MALKAIWAQSTDRVIGDGHGMPWHLPEDLQHFKRTTISCPVVMGRRTWESLPKPVRPLPGRRNIVISSTSPDEWSCGAEVVHSTDDVRRHAARCDSDVWVIGGGTIYQALLPHCDQVVVTDVEICLADKLGDSAVYAPALPDDAPRAVLVPRKKSSSGLYYAVYSVDLTQA